MDSIRMIALSPILVLVMVALNPTLMKQYYKRHPKSCHADSFSYYLYKTALGINVIPITGVSNPKP